MKTALLAAWLFSRVLASCTGGWEQIDHYELIATHLRVTMTAICTDDQGQAYACEETTLADPIPFRQIPEPGTGTDVVIPEDYVGHPELLPTCAIPTCVTAWPFYSPVVAVDTAGHTSLEACP